MEQRQVDVQPTPNPNALKFTLDCSVFGEAPLTFYSPEAAQTHSLAAEIFALPGVSGVMLLRNFASVTKRNDHDWSLLVQPIVELLRAHAAAAPDGRAQS